MPKRLTVSRRAFLACACVKPIADNVLIESSEGSGPEPEDPATCKGASISTKVKGISFSVKTHE